MPARNTSSRDNQLSGILFFEIWPLQTRSPVSSHEAQTQEIHPHDSMTWRDKAEGP